MELGPRLRRWLVIGLLAAVVGVLPALHAVWRLQPTQQLDLLVFDVTVTDGRYVEHAVLDRVLQHERVPFDLGSDHVGSAPGGAPYGTWPETEPDLIVLADGYGVYTDDEGLVSDVGTNRVSRTIDALEAVDLVRWIRDGVPAYGEFSMTAEPTPARASERIQEAFGFDATGWIGVAVDDLAEVSPRLQELGPDPWPHDGPGIVLVTTTAGDATPDRRIVVLDRSMLDSIDPVFVGGLPASRGERAPFRRWFELVEPAGAATGPETGADTGTGANTGTGTGTVSVDAWIELPVNDAGRAALDEAGLPARWPGVITTDNTIYVAGDGLEDTSGFSFRHFAGGDWLSWHFDDRPEERFFHQILRPALTTTIDRAVARRS